MSLRDRYVQICIINVDIRKLIHALDDKDNYKSAIHTDFSTNFLKLCLEHFLDVCFITYSH